jgi:glycosyltransferase involved in cell wall biosynthesis
MDLDVSVVVPVYNERDAVRDCLLELQAIMDTLDYSYEIVVVDDGCTDDSMGMIADLNVRVIHLTRNFGGGFARVVGMAQARGNVILQTDADGTYPTDKIPAILSRMENADMVIGARRREAAKDWRLLRVFAKWVLKTLAGILAGEKIPDLNSGLRAYKRNLAMQYAHLYPRGHSIMSTMTLAFMTEGHVVKFVETEYRSRIGRSTFHPVKDTYQYWFTIIRTIVFFNPLKLLIPVSLFFGSLALIFSIRDLIQRNIADTTVLMWTFSILIFILAIVSDQLSRLSRQIHAYFIGTRRGDLTVNESKEVPREWSSDQMSDRGLTISDDQRSPQNE